MTLEARAREIVAGADAPVDEIGVLAGELRSARRTALVAEMLIAVARRALYHGWRPDEREELATEVLRDHQQFGYARRLLARVRASTDTDSEELRQQHALCTYKDLELPARQRLDRALEILQEDGRLEDSSDAETLGIAGAIYKRRWEVDGKREDLENALACYQRGFEVIGDRRRWYAGINAAFVADRLAALEDEALGESERASDLRGQAHEIRREIVDTIDDGEPEWNDATLGEALFGLEEFPAARERFERVRSSTPEVWRRETTAMQLAALARLRGFHKEPEAEMALKALVGEENQAAVDRALLGKVGVALSGGGFRASLFHIGVLARLAECGVLRRVEVLSCVSGGSILGAYYYLKLQRLLEGTPDRDVTDSQYVELVREMADRFPAAVGKNLRRRLVTGVRGDLKMTLPWYSRTDRVGELFEELFFGPLRDEDGAWRMPDLLVKPAERGENFSLRYENWLRAAKVPMLVINATTLNTGHSWQFTASWMGEPPLPGDQRVDASRRLRRVYYRDAPDTGDLQAPALGKAVAASACVSGLFPPIKLKRLYDGIDVELVDGGVHDNQGVASLLEQDCSVILVSDASGQPSDDEDPSRLWARVLFRTLSVVMKRVRTAQYADLLGRRRSGALRRLMAVHLTKGLPAPPRDWSKCQEPWTEEDDALPAGAPAYGIDEGVQRALAQMRTDLDAFSPDEAYALMAAGYRMTECDLTADIPELAESSVAPAVPWPFADHLAKIESGDPALVEALCGGEIMVLRGPRGRLRRWLARM